MGRLRKVLRWCGIVAIGVVLGLLVTAIGFLLLDIRGESEAVFFPAWGTPADWGFDYQDVRIASAEVTLAGWYMPSENGAAIVLVHPGSGSRISLEGQARLYASHGYGVLTYDRRAIGESTGELVTSGWFDAPDLVAVVDWLAERDEVDPSRIGVFGSSVGGGVALRAAAVEPRIAAVIADGPNLVDQRDFPPFEKASDLAIWLLVFTESRLKEMIFRSWAPPSVSETIAAIAPRPILLISTSPVERRCTKAIFDLAGQPKELYEIPEAGHGGGWKARPEEYPARILAFFERTLAAREQEG